MPWVAAAATVAGAVISSNAASNAADQQQQSANASLALQKQQHDQTVANLAPYNTSGQNALSQLDRLNSGDFSSFTQSPDYQFALQQGTKAMDASAAARGNLFSGGYGQQMQQYGQGLATQNYNNYYNHLTGIAGLGENAAAMVGNANTSYANSGTNINTNAGQAQALGTLGQAGAWNNALNGISSAFGQYGSSYGGGQNGGGMGSWNGNQSWYPSVPANDNFSAPPVTGN